MIHFQRLLRADSGVLLMQCKEGAIQIHLDECAKNAARELNRATHCVAERDATALQYVFFTSPRTTLQIQRGLFPHRAYARFRALQAAIERCGYSSYDLS